MSEPKQGKRRHVRKIAAWPAWLRFHRSASYIKGRTKNISRGGAYVVLPPAEKGRVGEAVDFILAVPDADTGDFIIQTIDGEASVARVEEGDDGGLALRFIEEQDIE